MKTCMGANCGTKFLPGKQGARGLCNRCYKLAWKLVSVDGRTTWEELEALGLCEPDCRKKNPFLKAFEAAKQESSSDQGQPNGTTEQSGGGAAGPQPAGHRRAV